jgi:hypothetical protein
MENSSRLVKSFDNFRIPRKFLVLISNSGSIDAEHSGEIKRSTQRSFDTVRVGSSKGENGKVDTPVLSEKKMFNRVFEVVTVAAG